MRHSESTHLDIIRLNYALSPSNLCKDLLYQLMFAQRGYRSHRTQVSPIQILKHDTSKSLPETVSGRKKQVKSRYPGILRFMVIILGTRNFHGDKIQSHGCKCPTKGRSIEGIMALTQTSNDHFTYIGFKCPQTL